MKITKYTQAAELWQEYKEGLRNYLLKKTKDPEMAEELAQEVLMKVYKSCCSGSEIANVRSWLFQISYNSMADFYKSRKKFSNKLPDTAPSAENGDLVWKEMAEYVEPLLRLLPEKYSVPLRLSDLEGMKQAEIANKLNLSLTATKTRIQRARELLRSQIVDCSIMEREEDGSLSGFSIRSSCKPLQEPPKNI